MFTPVTTNHYSITPACLIRSPAWSSEGIWFCSLNIHFTHSKPFINSSFILLYLKYFFFFFFSSCSCICQGTCHCSNTNTTVYCGIIVYILALLPFLKYKPVEREPMTRLYLALHQTQAGTWLIFSLNQKQILNHGKVTSRKAWDFSPLAWLSFNGLGKIVRELVWREGS